MEPEFADLEEFLVDYLTGQDWDAPPPSAGVVLPVDWRPATHPPFLQVAVDDATETQAWQRPGALSRDSLVRLTAYASTRPLAKHLAASAHTALMQYPARPVSGVAAGIDPDTRAPIATCTVAITQQPD